MKTMLKNARNNLGLKSREVAAALSIDQTLVSRFENGARLPTKKQLHSLAKVLQLDYNQLLKAWLKAKVLKELKGYAVAKDVVQSVQEELQSYYPAKIVLPNDVEQALNKIDQLKQKLDAVREKNNYRITEALEIEYTFESNRIEGNTLTLRETDFVVNKGLTISGKSMREHLEAINHQEAIDYIKHLASKFSGFSQTELLQIHNLILRGIDSSYAGKYRNVQVIIGGSKHKPVPPYLVDKEMEDYFLWYNQNKDRLHPVVLAAEMHERLVTIHPFIDGNGRTARLVMNLFLISNGYVIANLKGNSEARMHYYDALEQVQIHQSKEEFVRLIVSAELDALENLLTILGEKVT